MVRGARAAGMIFGGLSLPESSELLAAYVRVGIRAYLLPGSLIREPAKLSSFVASARLAAEAAGLGRILIAIGGNETPAFGLPPFPPSPSPLGLASSQSMAAARRAGVFLGSSLASCGVDMVLAPRLDLASDPKDPAGALGGFGEDSRLAGALGMAFIRGLTRAGVAACIGHFPGLGTTSQDCNTGMAFVALPVERLERCEMRPFARVVASGVAAVLVGRALVPALESERIPASASARIIEGRLRESLGFQGLVIGDDISPGEDPGKAAVLGALAGCDLCLYTRPDDVFAAAETLGKSASTGELPAVRIEICRRRLDSLLSRRPSFNTRPRAISDKLIQKSQKDIEDCVSVLRGSITLADADQKDFRTTFILVFLPPSEAPDAFESDAVLKVFRSELPGAEILGITANPSQKDADDLIKVISPRGRYSEATILTYDAHFRPAQEGLARLVEEFIPNFSVIAMRDPYDAAFFPNAVGLGAAYGFSRDCAYAVSRLISGKLIAHGKRPVEVIGLEI
jgi:beta-N-acetylhexosaminidase